MPKILEIIAGPNGSGKTTFAETIFAGRKNHLYINSDVIASGLTLNGSMIANFQAGRYMLKAIQMALKNGKSFGFETTFLGKIWASYIEKAKRGGYKIIIYFVFVKSISISLNRIRTRVKMGGHLIPEKIVRRRFLKTFNNFWNIYKKYADEWRVLDNTKLPMVVAEYKDGQQEIFNKKLFSQFFQK